MNGGSLNICFDELCVTPRPTATSTATPTPTPEKDVSCPTGLELEGRYRISADGLEDVFISKISTEALVKDFYGYSGSSLTYAAADYITRDNASTIIVHEEASTGKHSLIIVNGAPLSTADGEFVNMVVEVSQLPSTFSVELIDDPNVDTFIASPTAGTVEAAWTWKRPYTDGIVISMPQEEFCIDLTVISNTYASVWNFFSGQSILEDVRVKRIDSFLLIQLCYELTKAFSYFSGFCSEYGRFLPYTLLRAVLHNAESNDSSSDSKRGSYCDRNSTASARFPDVVSGRYAPKVENPIGR